MTLGSTAFAEGGKIPCAHVATFCAGQQQSPPFEWTGAPEGTQSYALVMRDVTVANVHWVLYDIPVSTSSLPVNVARDTRTPVPPAGAKQSRPPEGFGTDEFGYFGPCPVVGADEHSYTFTLYARPVATEEGVTAATTGDELAAIVSTGALAVSALTGVQDAKTNTCSDE